MTFKTIKTERLLLKPYSLEDEKAMIHLLTNEQIKQTFMIPDLPTEAARHAMFLKLFEWSRSMDHVELGIYLHEQLIGFINDVTMEQDTIELGFVIDPSFHGQGYATEALMATIAYLFHYGFKEIIAGAFTHNMASIRVLEKCGLHPTDRVENITYRGHTLPCRYYSIKAK